MNDNTTKLQSHIVGLLRHTITYCDVTKSIDRDDQKYRRTSVADCLWLDSGAAV